MAEGMSNAAVARKLVVTDGAVEKHISNIFLKQNFRYFDALDPGRSYVTRMGIDLASSEKQTADYTARVTTAEDEEGMLERAVGTRIAWKAGNLVMFVDELPEVTKANKAPPTWRRCVNVGRSYRLGGLPKSLGILADGQRMAEIDKSFISNLDIVHSGRLNDLADAKRMANTLGVKYSEILALPDLHYIEKRADTPQATRGILKFTKKIAAPRR